MKLTDNQLLELLLLDNKYNDKEMINKNQIVNDYKTKLLSKIFGKE